MKKNNERGSQSGRILDRIRAEQDLLIKSLSDALRHNGAIAALLACAGLDEKAADLGEGSVAREKDDMKRKTKQKPENGNADMDRKAPFRFDSYGIPVGTELTYTKDSSIRPVVADSRQVEYDNRLWTLSGLATELNGSPANGLASFRCNGERLVNLRNRMDAEAGMPRK